MTDRSLREGPRGVERRPPPFGAGHLIDHRYEVVELLADGTSATVWKVRHAVLGRTFALKALRSEADRDAEFSERFRREARVLAALEHPNIVAITDFGHLPEGAPYFVMDYVDGEGLDRLLERLGRLDVALAVDVAAGICAALAAAHGAGVVHRDLKPSNVWVGHSRARSRVKVLDFGLARSQGDGRLTQRDATAGTPEYMSPEQARGRRADSRSDVYSVGITLYEMLSGHPPFVAGSYAALSQQHLRSPVPPLLLAARGVPLATATAVEVLVARCLEKDPERRFASAAELLEALRPLGVPEPTLRLPSRAGGRPPRRQRWTTWPRSTWRGGLRVLRVSMVARWVVVGCALGTALLAIARWLLAARGAS